MSLVVADTSALVSFATAAEHEPNPLDVLLDSQRVFIPTQVVEELRGTVAYDDVSGEAAQTVLDRLPELHERNVQLDATFPLDDGENAAVSLANEIEADTFLCDEFNKLGLIHASLVDTRLLTTPILLAVFVRNESITADEAFRILAQMANARSWDGNSYVERASHTLQRL